MTETPSERLHIIEGTNWKEAVIALIDPRSRHHPWRYGFSEVHEGDPVALVFNTDPSSILTVLGRVGAYDQVVFGVDGYDAGLLDLTTLTLLTGLKSGEDLRRVWSLHGDAAIKLELALQECSFSGWDALSRFGHTSLTAARILLHSNGECAGCATRIGVCCTIR